MLVGASEKGVCAIFLGDDPDALARELQDRFPKARLLPGEAAFDEWVARVVGFVEEPRLGLDLPLDIRGTAFQVRVWNALRRIPPGTTVSYTEIAKRLRMPKAARAVGAACGANPIAVAIPCHRVVRTDESLCGYRWGIEQGGVAPRANAGKRTASVGLVGRNGGRNASPGTASAVPPLPKAGRGGRPQA